MSSPRSRAKADTRGNPVQSNSDSADLRAKFERDVVSMYDVLYRHAYRMSTVIWHWTLDSATGRITEGSNRQYLWIKILTLPPFRSFRRGVRRVCRSRSCAGTNECDQVRRVDGTPAGLSGLDQLVGHSDSRRP